MTPSPAFLLLAASVCLAADLKPEATQAFDRYTRDTEARLTSQKPFLWADGSPERIRQLQKGQVLVEAYNGKPDTSVPGALIHDWIGAVFIPGATLEKALAVMQNYNHHKEVYHDVLDSKLLAQNGNDFKFYRLRQLKKGIINGVYHTEFDAHYERINETQWLSQSRSTLIAELENPGKPDQHDLPQGHDDGYLWRLNGYWRLEQRDNGVYLECEAVSLTRSLPAIVGRIIRAGHARIGKRNYGGHFAGHPGRCQEVTRLALIGYGNVARALARLLRKQSGPFPFRITGIHTARHGTAVSTRGLPIEPAFGPAAASIEAFLDAAQAEIAVELTTLNPATGEPATSHIRAAFARRMHVVTANKGPLAHAYADLRDTAARQGVEFRFESTVMDGAPVFNLVRSNLPGVNVLGFTGVLNSTSKLVIEAMERGGSFEDGIAFARRLGVAEANPSFDVEGWDSAAKTAALANVLMDARTTPQAVSTRGITRLTPERVQELVRAGKTVRLISRARRGPRGITLRVRAEVVDKTDLLASGQGTSNLLLLHTDLMGTIGIVSISPTVEQTAYGVFADLVDIA